MDGKDDCGDGSDEVPCKLVPCPTPETSSTTQTTTKRRTKTTTPTTTMTSTTTTATLSPVTRPAAIPFSCDKGQFRCESGECINGQINPTSYLFKIIGRHEMAWHLKRTGRYT
ncbi:hypothetical protein GCK32_013195 [Trichostrongylus colubriformis]|uniref:Uncharacterized protein n=1 Tax=Trichostrongylus colubriformis TaxID=6319 RepID=A0AAN8FTX2_TRICO